jgi:hypothetical protein
VFTNAQLLCALLLPAFLAAVLTAMLRDLRILRDGRQAPGLGGLVLAVVVVVAHAATASAVDACLIPPLLGWHWLPWAAFALVPALRWAAPRTPYDGRWLIFAGLAAGGGVLVLTPLCHGLSVIGITAWSVAITLSALVTAWTLAENQAGSLETHLAAGIASGAVALGALLCGSKDLALLAGIVPIALIGSGVVHLIRHDPWLGGGLALGPLLAWHLGINATYSEMPWWTALLLALPLPLGALASRIGHGSRSRFWWRITVTAGVALLALALAATVAQPTRAANTDAPTDHY